MFEDNGDELTPTMDSVLGETLFVSKDVVSIPIIGEEEGETLVSIGA